MEIYNRLIEQKDVSCCLDYFLTRRMAELASIRDHMITDEDSFLVLYEQEKIIPNLRGIGWEYAERAHPDDEYCYHIHLEALETILYVMNYKYSCYNRYQICFDSDKRNQPHIEKLIEEYIRKQKRRNPEICYKKILELDPSLDIEPVLEHMIEVGKIYFIDLGKPINTGKMEDKLLLYPKQVWGVKEE